MVELPKTQEELDALLNAKANETRESVTKEFNNKFAEQRTRHEQEIKKLKDDAGKTAEQLAQERIKEQQEKDAKELEDLRNYKRSAVIGEKLAKEGLPLFFKNDQRLLSAEEGDYDKVIKDIRKEYDAALPKGNAHSNVIQQGGAQPVSGNKTDVEIANEKFAEALNAVL